MHRQGSPVSMAWTEQTLTDFGAEKMDRSPEKGHRAHGVGEGVGGGGGIFWASWQLHTLAPLPQFFSNYAVIKPFCLFENEERNTNKGHAGLIKLIPIHVPARCLRRH